MKINGKKPEVNTDIFVIPRGEEHFVFKLKAVMSYDEFDKICPKPDPPIRTYAGGAQIADPSDSEFVKSFVDYNMRRVAWLTIKTLEATEGLEWETVRYDDPTSWCNWRKELEESNFNTFEINALEEKIYEVNSVNSEIFEKAKQDFLSGVPQGAAS